jgi:hypothetical protein
MSQLPLCEGHFAQVGRAAHASVLYFAQVGRAAHASVLLCVSVVNINPEVRRHKELLNLSALTS